MKLSKLLLWVVSMTPVNYWSEKILHSLSRSTNKNWFGLEVISNTSENSWMVWAWAPRSTKHHDQLLKMSASCLTTLYVDVGTAEHYKTFARWRRVPCGKIRFLPTIKADGINNIKMFFVPLENNSLLNSKWKPVTVTFWLNRFDSSEYFYSLLTAAIFCILWRREGVETCFELILLSLIMKKQNVCTR